MNQPIIVVGGQNIDLCGTPFLPPVGGDSNPGTVTASTGGVGHNIACNLALMGEDVRFLGVFGSDRHAVRLEDRYRELGVDISLSLRCAGDSSVYLYITDHSGEMLLAVSDMALYTQLTNSRLEERGQEIRAGALCVADTNLSPENLRWLTRNTAAPLFVDAVSTAKAMRLRGLLERVHTLKLNRQEGATLTGLSQEDTEAVADALLRQGVKRVFLSLGAQGLYCADQNERLSLPCAPAKGHSTTGAGDTLTAALAWSWMRGLTLAESGRVGLTAAALCMESRQAVNPNMNSRALLDALSR